MLTNRMLIVSKKPQNLLYGVLEMLQHITMDDYSPWANLVSLFLTEI